MLGFMIFLIFICFLFTYLVYGIYLSTIYKNDKSYNDNGELIDNKYTMQWGFRFCIGISAFLLLIVTMFSSSVTMADFWMALLLFGIIGGITSLLISRRQKKKNNRNDFKKINRNTLILIVLLFLFVGMTSETQDASSNESTAGVEESNDEVANQNNKQEEKLNEDEQKELSEKEKELNEREKELEEKERALEDQEEQELAAKEKAEREEEEKKLAKEQDEKEEQERIEKEEKERVAKEKVAKKKEKAETAKEGLIPVDLYRVVDGDTVNVFDKQGNELKLRLLLIDTPETVHPNKPVEPFGPEASERLTELVNSGEQLYIEYDDGDKTDHYGRHLVYLYVGDTNVHKVLLEEGLARVGYIYEQQSYLEEFKASEKIARDQQIGIWSIPGYVNETGEGFNSEENSESSGEVNASESNSNSSSESNEIISQPTQPGTGQYFKNCDDLRTVHPAGVPQGHVDYQPKMDRDKDGWACEI